MCLGIPMQIIAIEGMIARCVARGVYREVNLYLVQDAALAAGDFVLVHVGYALQKVDAAYARSASQLLADAQPATRTDDHA